MISKDLQRRLWPYLAGIARTNDMNALAVGGTQDHAHLLLSLLSLMSVAKAIQLIKGGSSKWIHETFPDMRSFAWQEGYGAFSIGQSQIQQTITYIHHQEEHHRRRSFEEEITLFLKKHGLEIDPKYIFG